MSPVEAKTQELVINSVQSAENIGELLPIMQHLPLSAVKQFIYQQITQLSNDSTDPIKKMYYEVASIDSVLPDEILQHIASFDGIYHPKSINRRWKTLCEKNQNNQLRKMYKTTAPTPADKGSTWIIHPTRKYLNLIETHLGYKGPITLRHALSQRSLVKEGDRLLIHDGRYYESTKISKDVSLIGLGKNVILEHDPAKALGKLLWISSSNKVTLENINFSGALLRNSISEESQNIIHCDGTNHEVTIRNCKFMNFEGVAIGWSSSSSLFNIIKCSFVNVLVAVSSYPGPPAGSESSKCNISQCSFENCGNQETNNNPIMVWHKDRLHLQCTGNKFKDCVLPLIVKWNVWITGNKYRIVDDCRDLYKLRDNVLIGNNVWGNQVFTANDIYEMYEVSDEYDDSS